MDDQGSDKPSNPILFHDLHRQRHAGADQTCVVTGNTQLMIEAAEQLPIEAMARFIHGPGALATGELTFPAARARPRR